MQKPLRRIILVFGILAFLTAGIRTYFLALNTLPYQLQISYHNRLVHSDKKVARLLYRDLNHDGYQERLVFVNELIDKLYYLKIYQDYGPGLIDQFNFIHPIIFNSPIYYDFNDDGHDEILVFTNDNQALYLTVIDAFNIRYLLFEQPLIRASSHRVRTQWDIPLIRAQIVHFNHSQKPQLLFAVNTGYALLPRCLCLYDFQSQNVVQRLNYHLGPVWFEVADLNNDGRQEIGLISSATNNFESQVYLSDAFAWFLLLDEDFHFIRPAEKIGHKFTNPYIFLLQRGKHKAFSVFSKSNILQNQLLVVDSTLQPKRKKLPESTLNAYGTNRLGGPRIFLSHLDPLIQVYDMDLNLQAEKKLDANQHKLVIAGVENLVGDTLPEIISYNNQGIFIYDHQLRLLAKYLFDTPIYFRDLTSVKKPDQRMPYLSYIFKDVQYFIHIKPNMFYSRFFWVFLGMFFSLFLLQFIIFKMVAKFARYIFSFSYLLKGSNNAIILLDYKGRIISINKKVNHFLKLERPLTKGDHIEQSLKQRPVVLEAIQKSRRELRKVHASFSLEESKSKFIGEVRVMPFVGMLGYVFAFLVEIADSTKQVLLERQRNWQRNVRKMVHDIKTPLAGVQLKLQMLYMQLQEQSNQLASEFALELEEAHNELKRISSITKSFLKVSDLEQLSINEIQLKPFVEQALLPFDVYNVNASVEIVTEFKPGVPEVVYWDEKQIELMLHILVENALDAIESEGKVTVEFGPLAKIRDVKEPWVQIRVIDNGKGIPSELKQKIFEPHFTTKYEGTGLGLTFAQHIVMQHGGHIDVFSTLNAGTIFVVSLPSRAIS